MRPSRYLNAILTVNAVLLAVLVWTQVAGHGTLPLPGAREAAAQAQPAGIPNAAAQRQQMIDSLRELRKSVEESNKLLKDGHLRVHVTNLHEIQIEKP